MWEETCAAGLMEQCLHDQDLQHMESVVEEAFEVQAYQPFHGWAFERFCDRSGNTFPALTDAALRIPGDDKLNLLSSAAPTDVKLELGVLPSADWMWSHAWMHDDQYTQCDDDGWSYGSTIARINRRLAEGTSCVRREYYHFRRRRRWIRTRIKKPTLALDRADDASTSTSNVVPLGPTAPRYYRVYNGPVLSHLALLPAVRLTHFETVPFTDEDVLDEGWLGQRGIFSRMWKLRYFILRHDRSTLVCLRDRASLIQLSETIIDHHTTISIEPSTNPQQFQFVLVNGRRQLWLNAVDESRRALWISSISELIVRKRASFYVASEGSESGLNSVRTNSYRRQRSYNDSSYRFPKATTTTTNDSNDMVQDPSEHHRRGRRCWRPYRIHAATMQSNEAMVEQLRQDYVVQFEAEFAKLLTSLQDFLTKNITILEQNLETTEPFLAPAVEIIRREHLGKIRKRVELSLVLLQAEMNRLSATGQANVLKCNILRKRIYEEATRLNSMILLCAQPLVQATVKKVSTESPASNRRIPDDWFRATPPPNPQDLSRRFSADAALGAHMMSSFTERSVLTPHTEGMRTPSEFSSRSRNVSFTDSSSLLSTSHSTTSVPFAAAVKVKSFVSVPPSLSQGHFDLPSGINDYVFIVDERDVGSMIGYVLCSHDYVDAIEKHFNKAISLADELKAEEARSVVHALTGEAPALETASATSKESLYIRALHADEEEHPEIKFEYGGPSSKHEVACVTYFAAQFHGLRALSGNSNFQFLCSIAQSHRWIATGGKSGAFFSMTHDKRYVLKGIPATEFNMFLHTAPQYFRHMAKALGASQPTVISKILGLYKLTHIRRHAKHVTYVVVMENVRYLFPEGQIYDIKGLQRRRYSGSLDDEETVDSQSFVHASPMEGAPSTPTSRRSPDSLPVLLDGNLMERIPIPVRQADLKVIEEAIQHDTNFLCDFGVIDYSLLMVFNEEHRQVGVGLIDYLHQYDFLKKMESGSKASLTFRDPTIVSPPSYQRRFVNAMHRYLVGIEEDLEARIRKHIHSRVKVADVPSGPSTTVTNTAAASSNAASGSPAILCSTAAPIIPVNPRVHRTRSFEAFPSPGYDVAATQAFSEGGGLTSMSSIECSSARRPHTALIDIFPDLIDIDTSCASQSRPPVPYVPR